MLNNPQRFDDPLSAMQASIDASLVGVSTCTPGEIVSYDATAMTATVQPLINKTITAKDGTVSSRPCAVLTDVPVQFPSGGNVTLTFPVAAGDECLLVFSGRGIDSWFEYGGTQPPFPERLHHVADAFAIVGIRSKPRVLSPAPSTTAAQLRSDDGSVYIELAGGKPVQIVAPKGLHIVGAVTTTSTIKADGDVIGKGVSLASHVHSGVEAGSSETGAPVV